jgi:hypothetical protein
VKSVPRSHRPERALLRFIDEPRSDLSNPLRTGLP